MSAKDKDQKPCTCSCHTRGQINKCLLCFDNHRGVEGTSKPHKFELNSRVCTNCGKTLDHPDFSPCEGTPAEGWNKMTERSGAIVEEGSRPLKSSVVGEAERTKTIEQAATLNDPPISGKMIGVKMFGETAKTGSTSLYWGDFFAEAERVRDKELTQEEVDAEFKAYRKEKRGEPDKLKATIEYREDGKVVSQLNYEAPLGEAERNRRHTTGHSNSTHDIGEPEKLVDVRITLEAWQTLCRLLEPDKTLSEVIVGLEASSNNRGSGVSEDSMPREKCKYCNTILGIHCRLHPKPTGSGDSVRQQVDKLLIEAAVAEEIIVHDFKHVIDRILELITTSTEDAIRNLLTEGGQTKAFRMLDREARIDELNKLIAVVGPLIDKETWKDWAWRVKDYLESRTKELESTDNPVIEDPLPPPTPDDIQRFKDFEADKKSQDPNWHPKLLKRALDDELKNE